MSTTCDHVWGTDGQHSNEFCKKCFVTKPNVSTYGEPWKAVGSQEVRDRDGALMGDVFVNRARVLLCVNALAGIPDAELPGLDVQGLRAERDQARAHVELLAACLADCADDLEGEMEGKYSATKDHPAMKLRYDRDTASVVKARAALAIARGKGA